MNIVFDKLLFIFAAYYGFPSKHQGPTFVAYWWYWTNCKVSTLFAIPIISFIFLHDGKSFTYFYREMIEVSIAPKSQKLSASDHAQLTDLLLSKDSELKKTLELAEEQAKIQQKMNELQAEVDSKVIALERMS